MQALYELKARQKSLGMVSICAAGGLGVVAVVEAI
jgi:acetyl-CoA acetyltransferase